MLIELSHQLCYTCRLVENEAAVPLHFLVRVTRHLVSRIYLILSCVAENITQKRNAQWNSIHFK